MPRGDKDKYTDKQKRKAEHIEEGYKDRGVCRRGGAAGLGDGQQGFGRRQQVGLGARQARQQRLGQERRKGRRRSRCAPFGLGTLGLGKEGRSHAQTARGALSPRFPEVR
jgi:hypothetical protein